MHIFLNKTSKVKLLQKYSLLLFVKTWSKGLPYKYTLCFLLFIDNTLSNKNDTFMLSLLKTVSCDIYGLREDGEERRY